MIEARFEEAHSPEWVKENITDRTNELVILRQVIPWQEIISRLIRCYDDQKGRLGKSLRMMVAILIVTKLRGLSDPAVVAQIKENRYLQYFCNVPDEGLPTFLNSSTICTFRKRIGEQGANIIEAAVFNRLRRCGVIAGDTSLIDSTVLNNPIIYPNDVQLIFKGFGKMVTFAKAHNLPLWWDHKEVKKHWRACLLQAGLWCEQETGSSSLSFAVSPFVCACPEHLF